MRSKGKPKFRVGQVVRLRKSGGQGRWGEYVELGPRDRGGDRPAWYTSKGYTLESELMPLTAREAGPARGKRTK